MTNTKTPTKKFTVEIGHPDGVTRDALKEYIEEALQNWCKSYEPPGGYEPDSPGHALFNIGNSVKVTNYRRPTSPYGIPSRYI